MGNRKARNARARESKEAEIREAREAQDREAREAREAQCIREDRAREATARYARWKTFGVCTVLWSIGSAVLGFGRITSMFDAIYSFCLLLFVFLLIPPGQDRLLAGMLGAVLGTAGVSVLGLHHWVWSWILPIASFRMMENGSVPIALLLCVERVVLIVGVAVLGWRSGLALDVAIIIVETETHSRWARSWLWQNGLAKWRRCTGFKMYEVMGDDGLVKRSYESAPRDVWEIVAGRILIEVFDFKLTINGMFHHSLNIMINGVFDLVPNRWRRGPSSLQLGGPDRIILAVQSSAASQAVGSSISNGREHESFMKFIQMP